MIPSKLVRGSDSSRGFFYTHSGKGGMPLCEIDADHVLDELANCCFQSHPMRVRWLKCKLLYSVGEFVLALLSR